MIKTIEYLLWNNCNNNCLFCNMKDKYQNTEEDKLKAIELVKDNIEQQKEPFNILLVGGELFANLTDKIKNKLIELYNIIFNNKNINIIYINTNLLYSIPTTLQLILDKAPIERIHLTTSDDIVGRFKTKEDMFLFFDNLDYLRWKYPKLNIVVNTILTKPFCEYVLKCKYNIKNYREKNKVNVNIIPYIDINSLETLKTTKEEVLKTLLILKQQDSEWFNDYVDIMTRQQQMTLLQYDKKENTLKNMTAEINVCGHSINFKRVFLNSNECFGCIINEMK